MHGASNDFIMFDDREETFPVTDSAWIRKTASRRTGVGCDGVILIQPSKKADFRMRFFNPDGSEVEMCANGARCVALLANEIGAAPEKMSIETIAGILSAKIEKNGVKLGMTPPKNWNLKGELTVNGQKIAYGFVNTGVPHVVTEIDKLQDVDIRATGSAIRYHKTFSPAGTNANFVSVTGPQSISVRTYERGVEDETLACGTGITASALIMTKLGKVKPPVLVKAASGDILTVDFKETGDGASDVTLLGPAVHVFEGSVIY